VPDDTTCYQSNYLLADFLRLEHASRAMKFDRRRRDFWAKPRICRRRRRCCLLIFTHCRAPRTNNGWMGRPRWPGMARKPRANPTASPAHPSARQAASRLVPSDPQPTRRCQTRIVGRVVPANWLSVGLPGEDKEALDIPPLYEATLS